MRLSQSFWKTSKTTPADETARNAQLLIRAGFIHKEMAGVYAYLPLGLKVLENIEAIVRKEMNAIGSQELIMTNLQPQEPWAATSRWDDQVVDIWFKTKLKDETEIGLAWSHEEAILEMLSHYIDSYRDLPVSVYQFQTKLRNELRAKAGIMRGREFVMKDMYSLHANAEDLDKYYRQVTKAYERIFDRLGIGEETFVTFASGGDFTKFSHEFQTICKAGEDWLYLDRQRGIAVNEEVLDDVVKELELDRPSLEKVRSAEVGNIFNFGTEKAAQMGIGFTDKDGQKQPIYLGSYGIGITRVMGVIVEKMSDEKGLVWPENIAPARVYLVRIGDDSAVVQAADQLYDELTDKNIATIYDDRDVRPGEKFADADLVGIPHRVVISARSVVQDKLEYKSRTDDNATDLTKTELFDKLSVPH